MKVFVQFALVLRLMCINIRDKDYLVMYIYLLELRYTCNHVRFKFFIELAMQNTVSGL